MTDLDALTFIGVPHRVQYRMHRRTSALVESGHSGSLRSRRCAVTRVAAEALEGYRYTNAKDHAVSFKRLVIAVTAGRRFD